MKGLLNTNDFGLLSLIDPTLYQTIVQCILQLSQNCLSYGLRIGHTLVKITQVVEADGYIYTDKKENGVKAREIQKSAKLFLDH